MKNSFEVDLIKFSKGAYQIDDLSYEQCFSIMCDYHYGNGYLNSWKPSDEWVLNRCLEVYERYFNMKNFVDMVAYQMAEFRLQALPSMANYFDNQTWRTMMATQLMNALSMLPVVKYDPHKKAIENMEIYKMLDEFKNGIKPKKINQSFEIFEPLLYK